MDWLEHAYRTHRADVLGAATAVLRDRDAAEDVVQEVFLRLGRDGRYDPARGSLGPYLRMLGRSRAIDAHRSRGAADRTHDRWSRGDRDGSTAAAGEQALLNADRARVRAAVRALPGPQREALALTYWGDMSASAVAASTGTPLGTVKSRVRLGLQRLRDAEAA